MRQKIIIEPLQEILEAVKLHNRLANDSRINEAIETADAVVLILPGINSCVSFNKADFIRVASPIIQKQIN